jgi:hypothetical protein
VNGEVQGRAASLWRFRAGVELEAAARFRGIARRLAALDADPEVVALARRACDDEIRHHHLCAELAQSFGARDIPCAVGDVPPVTMGRACPRQQLLAEVVAMSCVTESLSTALLIEMRRAATESHVRQVVHEVLRDEVDHARLGWTHLAAESARGTPVAWLGARLPDMLAATVHEEIFAETSAQTPAARALEGLGGLCRRTRCDLFVGTMEGVVFRGLERFGVRTDAGRHWLRRSIGSAQRVRTQQVRELGEHLGQG